MILILAVYIALLSFAVKSFAGQKRHRWINAGYFTAFLLPFLIYFVFMGIIAPIVQAGIGVSFFGFVFAGATLITGFVFLYIGYSSQTVEDD
ncbi:hypothetical protein FQV26_07805 [Planococcus sp. CPCC 101016]|uniref:hypothetical protein n=1 Tax=Planococcus sp. CPCC 101016 TaxID=2599617 RepID=UPI0011B6D560|nr:hypothetical protein [Planococcus sp. CPCC 101016]TWT07704.1 hypothetical protein FQV26_07805 [Planococcus sp. CPCC 101016]